MEEWRKLREEQWSFIYANLDTILDIEYWLTGSGQPDHFAGSELLLYKELHRTFASCSIRITRERERENKYFLLSDSEDWKR